MKTKTIKILMVAGILMLTGQTEAAASSTQVTFQVPVNRSNGYTITSAFSATLRCVVTHGGTVIARSALVNRTLYRYASTPIVPIVVHPFRGSTFQKGDAWKCLYSSGDPNLDRGRSRLMTQGTL